MATACLLTLDAYDPSNRQHRVELAAALLSRLEACGFVEDHRPGTRERVFGRAVHTSPGVRVLVYTSVVGDEVRREGKDAIRVVAIYRTRDERERGIARADKRVNRTGDIPGIVERVYQRMRDVYGAAMNAHKCGRCGAPKFKSKAGNEVCADICWKED